MLTKICIQCGEKFEINKHQSGKLFCSDNCRDDAHEEQAENKKYLDKQKELKLKQYELVQLELNLFEEYKKLVITKEQFGWSKIKEPKKPKPIDL